MNTHHFFRLKPYIKYKIPGTTGTSRLMLRFASVKSPTRNAITIGTIIKNPPTLGYFQPQARPIKIIGIIVRAIFSHNE